MSLHALIMLYSKKLSCKEEDAHKKITSIFEGFATLMIWIVNQQGLIDDKVRIDFVSNINAFFDKYADIFEKGTRL